MAKVIIGLVCAIALNAQQVSAPSITQTLVKGLLKAQGTQTVTIQNIGQSVHQIYGRIVAGGACTPDASNFLSVSVYGADAANTTPSLIGSQVSISTGSFPQLIVQGLYPYLYAQISVQGPTDGCTADVYYAGTSNGLTGTLQMLPASTFTVNNSYVARGMVVAGLGSGLAMKMLPVCDSQAIGSVTAGVTSAVITANNFFSGVGTTVQVCSIMLWGTAASTTATLTSGTGATCGGATVTYGPAITLNTTPVPMGNGVGQLFNWDGGTSGSPKSLCIAAAVGNVGYIVRYAQQVTGF